MKTFFTRLHFERTLITHKVSHLPHQATSPPVHSGGVFYSERQDRCFAAKVEPPFCMICPGLIAGLDVEVMMDRAAQQRRCHHPYYYHHYLMTLRFFSACFTYFYVLKLSSWPANGGR
jgi:hypothetical protein